MTHYRNSESPSSLANLKLQAASPPARVMSTAKMGNRFHELTFTPLVKEEQEKHNSRRQYDRMSQTGPSGEVLGINERTFIGLRDSFYMALCQRGQAGPIFSIAAARKASSTSLGDSLIGFADLRGNKQLHLSRQSRA